MAKIAVVALGGNAILKKGEEGDIHQQFAHTRESLASIVELIEEGYRLAITHGNGPQAGNELIRVELSKQAVPELPLGVIDAATEGWMGYMIQQSLQNRLHLEGIDRRVLTVPTQVIVDRGDPNLAKPSKPIGPFYTKEEAKLLREKGVLVKEDAGRGYRRVVPSPIPLEIVEKETIRELVSEGVVVIAAGGGGIPVYVEDDGTLEGVDAVIDKDRAAAVLARDIGADLLLILTNIDKVALNYNTLFQKDLDLLTTSQAKRYMGEGHFPPGSMGPKIEAAMNFLEWGGAEVIIASLEKARQALEGKAGTKIVKDTWLPDFA